MWLLNLKPAKPRTQVKRLFVPNYYCVNTNSEAVKRTCQTFNKIFIYAATCFGSHSHPHRPQHVMLQEDNKTAKF